MQLSSSCRTKGRGPHLKYAWFSDRTSVMVARLGLAVSETASKACRIRIKYCSIKHLVLVAEGQW